MGVEGTRPSTGELSVCWEGHPSRGYGGPPAQGGGSRHAPRRRGLAPRVPGGGLTPRAQEPGASRAVPCAPEVGFFCRARKKWGLIPRVPGASRAQEGGLAPCHVRWGRGLALGSGAQAARTRVRADPARAKSENSLRASRGGPVPAISGGSLHVPRKQGLAPRVPEVPACKGRGTRAAGGGYPRAQKGGLRRATWAGRGGIAPRVPGGGLTPRVQEPGGSRCGARTRSGGSRGACRGAPRAQEGAAPATHPRRGTRAACARGAERTKCEGSCRACRGTQCTQEKEARGMCVGKVGLAPGEGLAPRTHEVGAGAARAGGWGGRLRALETGDSWREARPQERRSRTARDGGRADPARWLGALVGGSRRCRSRGGTLLGCREVLRG